jgi:hypothetical protein
MTKKEIKAMSGECKTYRLNEPMYWNEFNSMPDDIKVSYITLIREKFGATDGAFAGMMQINTCSFSKEINRLGLSRGKCHGKPWDKEGFLMWANRVPVQAEETEDAPEIVAEEIRVEIPVELAEVKEEAVKEVIRHAIPESGSMTFEGKTEDILRTLGVLLGGAKVHIGITWDLLEVDNG